MAALQNNQNLSTLVFFPGDLIKLGGLRTSQIQEQLNNSTTFQQYQSSGLKKRCLFNELTVQIAAADKSYFGYLPYFLLPESGLERVGDSVKQLWLIS